MQIGFFLLECRDRPKSNGQYITLLVGYKQLKVSLLSACAFMNLGSNFFLLTDVRIDVSDFIQEDDTAATAILID